MTKNSERKKEIVISSQLLNFLFFSVIILTDIRLCLPMHVGKGNDESIISQY